MQFVNSVWSFLHIMIRHNVDICKNEPRFKTLIIFHLNCILLLMMKMNKKQFLFHSWKIRAEGRSPLICFLPPVTWINEWSIYLYKVCWFLTCPMFCWDLWCYCMVCWFVHHQACFHNSSVPARWYQHGFGESDHADMLAGILWF